MTIVPTNMRTVKRVDPPSAGSVGVARSAVALAAIVACTGAHSQTSAPDAPASAASSASADAPGSAKQERQRGVELQGVVITSNKRRQLQADVAGTVATVQGSQLEAMGARDSEDIFKLTPGVQFNKGASDNATLSIRGVSTNTVKQSLQQGTTGIYIEDVPVTDSFSQIIVPDVAPFDLSRVEVLKGPQGALYGSSSLGGAVRYLVNRPTRTFEGSVLTSVEGVSHGGIGGSVYGMINAPVNETTAVRAVVFRRQDAGYIDNVGIGRKDTNDLTQTGGRFLVSLRPNRDLDIQLMAMGQQTRAGDGNAVAPDPGQLSINTGVASKSRSDWSLFNAQVNYEIAGYRLTSNTGYQDKSRHDDGDATKRFGGTSAIADPTLPPFPLVTSINIGKVKSTSQEFRVSPTGAGPFSYVAGAFWQHSRYRNDQLWDVPGGAALLGSYANLLLPNERLADQRITAATTETAVFFDGELALTPSWTLGLGVRKYWTRFRYDEDIGAPLLGLPANTLYNPSTSDSGTIPKLSLKYRISAQAQWYAMTSQGYRFGGSNDIPAVPYKPDKLINYETGVRFAPVPGVSTGLSVYRMDWKDAQVTAVNPVIDNAVVIQNVGKAKIDGVELTVDWTPASAFRFDTALAYVDARTTEQLDGGRGYIYPVGTRLPGTSRLQASMQGTYRFTLADWSGRAMLTLASVGERYADLENQIKLPGYRTADARLTFGREAVELSLYANNLTDSRGQVSASKVGEKYLVRPRVVGVSVRYDF